MKDIASPKLRVLAGLVDVSFYLALNQILFVFFASAVSLTEALNRILLVIFFLFIIYPLLIPCLSIFLTSRFGGGVGKLLFGLEVLDENQKRLGLFRSFIRQYLGYTISGSFFLLGFFWIFRDKEHRAWHDLIANTKVYLSHKDRPIIGIVALILILVTNLFLTISIIRNFYLHQYVYMDLVREIQDLMKKENNPVEEAAKDIIGKGQGAPGYPYRDNNNLPSYPSPTPIYFNPSPNPAI